MHDEVVCADRALEAGARGHVMKQEIASVMLDAIRTVLWGGIYVLVDGVAGPVYPALQEEAPTCRHGRSSTTFQR